MSLELPDKILRTAKPKQPRDFQLRVAESSVGIGERRFIAVADLPFEFMLNALRLNEGFSSQCFESRTGLETEVFGTIMRDSADRGLIDTSDVGWKPTDLGRRFLNDLQSRFLE